MKVTNFIKKVSAVGLSALMCMSLIPSTFYASETVPEEKVSYCVTTIDKEEGQVILIDEEGLPVESNEYTEGETVYFLTEAAEGYCLGDIQILAENESIIESYVVTEEITAFTMPGSDVTISGDFVMIEESGSTEDIQEDTEETTEKSTTEETTVEETTTEETEAASEEDTTETSNEVETETPAEVVDIYASDFDCSSIEEIDFSSGRLLVAGDESIFVDRDVIVSSYDGLYILQFTDIETARRAYGYYSDKADMVIVDTAIYVADDADIIVDSVEETSEVTEETSEVAEETEPETTVIVEENPVDESLIMTEGDTPFDELKEALNDGVQSYDIALIDTGASNVTSAYSVIGDATSDDNGHGTKMVDAIYGQNQDARILSIKAADANGRADVSAIYAAFEYAISQNVKIINLSMSAIATSENAIIVDEIEKAVSLGITVVGAAGNNAANVAYFVPGKVDSALIIGAADETGTRLSSSNFGDTVDYNVYAESTSEAAAKFAGWISANDISAITDVLNQGLIFENDYDPAWPEGGIIYTTSGDFEISGSSSLAFPTNINVNVMMYLGQSDVLIYTNDSTLSQYNSYNDDNYGAGTHYAPVYCYERNNGTPKGYDYSYDASYLTQTQQAQIAYCIAHGFSINRKDSRFDGVSDIEAQILTQAAIAAITDGVNGKSLTQTVWYRNSGYGGATSSLTEQTGDGWHPISSQQQIYTNLGFSGNFQKAIDLYNEAVQNADSSYLDLIQFYNTSETYSGGTKYYQHVVIGYSTGATLTKSANVSTSTYPLTGALYSIYNSNNTWMGSFVTDSDGTGYVASYTTNKSDTTNASIVVQYGDGYYYSYKSTKILSLGTGTYTVYEKVAPNKYTLNTSGYTFTISTSNPYADLTSAVSNIFKDTMPGAVTLKKSTDANTQEYPLTGALYSVCKSGSDNWVGAFLTDADGTGYVASYTTDKNVAAKASIYVQYNGAYFYTNKESKSLSLEAGSYVLKERLAPSCYALNSDSTTFTVSEAVTKTLTSKDTLLSGAVTLKKSTSADISKYPLTGALYSVYTESNAWLGSFITDADGTGYVAKYTENQSEAAKGAIVVQIGKGYYYTDKSSKSLSLLSGTYLVAEKAAPSHYGLNSSIERFTVKAGATTNLTASTNSILSDKLLAGSVQITKSVDTPLGTIILQKSSSTPSVTEGNACYSLEGAVYGIYSDEACTNKIGEMTTDANGYASYSGLELKVYYAKEITAPKGYEINSEILTFDLSQYKNNYDKAAVYTIYDASNNVVGTLTCDATSGVSNTLSLTEGTYTLKETTAAKGYNLNTDSYKFTVSADKKTTITASDTNILSDKQTKRPNDTKSTTDVPGSDPIGISLEKKDSESSVSLEGAQFTIEYWDNGNKDTSGIPIRTWVVETNEKGLIYLAGSGQTLLRGKLISGEFYNNEQGNITWPIGTYRIKETKAPEGYLLSGAWTTAQGEKVDIVNDGYIFMIIQENQKTFISGPIELAKGDDVIKGSFVLTKEDSVTGNEVQGNAKDLTATFELINNSDEAVFINGTSYEKGQTIMTFQTDEEGNYKSEERLLPYGSYIVNEIIAPEGYTLNGTITASFTITTDGQVADLSGQFKDEIILGGFDFAKVDIETQEQIPQGGATLAGATFNVINKSEHSVVVDGTLYEKDDVVFTFQTDEEGSFTSETTLLPYGTYWIVETKSPEGYQLEGILVCRFTITEDGKLVESIGDIQDTVIRGGVEVVKYDAEFDKSESMYSSSLDGIEFEIVNANENSVVVRNTTIFSEESDENVGTKVVEPGEVVGKLIVHFDEESNSYRASTLSEDLPYGTYTIKEVAGGEGYVLTDEEERTFEINNMSEIVSADIDGQDLIFRNQVARGNFRFNKVNDKDEAIARCLFEVENILSGEIHYIITDENGVFNSGDRPVDADGNYLVNANDAFVTKNADGSYTISEADLQYTTVYFSEGEFGSTAEFNPENGSFTYGTYIFREIRTSVNEGLNLIYFSGTIYDSSRYLNSEPVVELGQKNDRAININTEAVDGDDGDKTLEYHLRETNVTIIDRVTYSGLEDGENVILEGFIWDKTNSRLLTDAEGQLITVSMPFTAHPGEDGTGTVDMTFTFDKELVKDTSHLVAFQVLYDEHHVLILNHMDDKDEDQTVLVKHAHYVMEKERVTEAPAKILKEDAEASEYGFRIGDTVTYMVTITNDGDVDLDMNVSDAFDEEIAECFTDLKISEIKNAEELQRVSDVETRLYIKAGETAFVMYTAIVSDKANEFLSKNAVDDGLGYHNVATTTNVTEHGGEEPILPDKEDDANTPVQLVPHYTMNKVRVTDAPIKSGTNQYGFYRGNTVTYAVTITNDGELPLTMDVSDAFESSIAAYFTNLQISKVEGQENQRINATTTNISIPVGEKVVVYYTAVVANNAPEYLAPTTADDKANDKDGYLNTATTTNVTAKYKNAEGNEVVLTKENADALKDMSDTANTPVQVQEVVTGDTMNGTPWMMTGLAMLAIGAAAVVILRKRSFSKK